jgi:hypothetical protein
MKQPETVLQATRPYFEASSEDRGHQSLMVLGGVAVAALASSATRIDTKRHEIIALASDADSPRLRKNGSVRDLDIYVPTSDKEILRGVYQEIEEAVGKDVLEISVFGNQPFSSLKNQRMWGNPAAGWTADRYETTEAHIAGAVPLVKAIQPFEVPLPQEALEPYNLIIVDDKDGKEVAMPVLHPAANIANYLSRSAGGLRKKDSGPEKFPRIAYNVLRDPSCREWLLDGLGKSQFELASVMRSLVGRGDQPLKHVRIPMPNYSLVELADHPAFMYRESLPTLARRAVIGMAAMKASGVYVAEQNEQLVSAWQQYGVEKITNRCTSQTV